MNSRIVSYISPFVPPEWIAAHGLQPRRVRAATAHALAEGVCPLAGAFLGFDGNLVLTTTCDQMRRVAERIANAFLLNVPATQGDNARRLYAEELRRLGRFLVRLGGQAPANAELIDIIERYEMARQPLRGPAECSGLRLALVGAPLRDNDQWILDLLMKLGACVTMDATDFGHRTLPAPIDPLLLQADPLEALARAYFAIPDVFRRPDTLLYDYLRRELTARQVKGILLVRYVWCDLWHAHVQRLREAFKLPLVEIDLGVHDAERTRTRVESLVQILR